MVLCFWYYNNDSQSENTVITDSRTHYKVKTVQISYAVKQYFNY